MLQCINFDILENKNVNLKHAKTHGESWLTFACSKKTIKTVEKDVKYVQS